MAKHRTTYMMNVKTGKADYLTRHYKPGAGVRLENSETKKFDPIVHVVVETVDSATKVSTACGIVRFVTYSQGTKKKPDCIHCLAASPTA